MRYTLDLEWTVQSPLRIGPETKDAEYDLPVIRIYIGGEAVPYIPGSSIKGVVRSAVFRELTDMGHNVCEEKNPCGKKYQRELEDAQRDNRIADVKRVVEKFCYLCKIFGTQGYRGRVAFGDAYPSQDSPTTLSWATGTRPGIAIDRLTGMVMENALFTTEYVAPNSKFHSRLIFDNMDDDAIALVLRAFNEFNRRRLKIGGLSTRGFGEVDVKIRSAVSHHMGASRTVSEGGPPTGDVKTDPNLSARIWEWASKKSIKSGDRRTQISTWQEEDAQRKNDGHQLIVRRGRCTERAQIDPAMSGLIRYAIRPVPGYWIHVGSNMSLISLDDATTKIVRQKIEEGKSFDEISKIISGMKLPSPAYHFAYLIVSGGAKKTVIPGSTLKGIIRSRTEHSLVPDDEGCVDSCFIKEGRRPQKSKHYVKYYGINGRIDRRGTCSDSNRVCIVCDMFGTAGLRGLVEFHDAELRGLSLRREEVRLGPNGPKTVYLIVAGEEEARGAFSGSIRFKNLPRHTLGLLLWAMGAEPMKGIRLGRYHLRDDEPHAFGLAKVNITRIEYDNGTIYGTETRDATTGLPQITAHVNELQKEAKRHFGDRLRELPARLAGGGP